MSLAKRITITLAILATPFILGMLLTYEVIKIEWVTAMQNQPSFRSLEAPLPLPAGSVPVQGAAYLPLSGSPENPQVADAASLARGKELYGLYCALCHGDQGKGDGTMADVLKRKPANLTGQNVLEDDDGTIFLIITRGVKGLMPPLRENMAPGSRWDVVNYVRSLQKGQ